MRTQEVVAVLRGQAGPKAVSFELHLAHGVFAEQRLVARTVQAEGQLTVCAVVNRQPLA